jgi:NADPH-dependent 2,4-dienoyl-CoA reductase/sulfur reductase-like enzyme
VVRLAQGGAVKRRALLQGALSAGVLGLGGCNMAPSPGKLAEGKVVVIGGGWGGATAARYLRLLSDYSLEVTLVEPNADFVSCPLSNLVIGGSRNIGELTTPYRGLQRAGVTLVRDMATAVDPQKKTVTLARGPVLAYDKLVIAPGVDLRLDEVQGLEAAHAAGVALHGWKAGPETVALRMQLEAMRDGGVFAITITEQPFRCPPAVYERACQVAWYFKRAKPKSKVLVLDANPDVISKPALFKRAWSELYPDLVEYRPQHTLLEVDAKTRTLKFEVQDDVQADVLNVVPPQRAGRIAAQAGLANQASNRWCGVHFLTFESTAARDVHVIGDAIQIASGMPKSGHMANSHAKVAAAAIVAQLADWAPNPQPMLSNTCYSFVDDRSAMHIASVHRYEGNTFHTVPGAGGLSADWSALEGGYAMSWARNLWTDVLG